MLIPEYIGFRSARERNQAIADFKRAVEDCESYEELNDLHVSLIKLLERLKAEEKENIEHWVDYEELLVTHFEQYRFYLQQKKDFIWLS